MKPCYSISWSTENMRNAITLYSWEQATKWLTEVGADGVYMENPRFEGQREIVIADGTKVYLKYIGDVE